MILQTLQSIAGMNIPKHDSIYATYPDDKTEVYEYKLESVTVGTITVNFSDSTKEVLISVIKS